MNIIKALAFLLAGGSTLLGFELHEHVNSPRWKVKTLADSMALPAEVMPSSIEEQCALPAPKVDESVARLPSERQVFAVTANLIAAKREFDGDYHLVLEDPVTHLHIIAEIPDTTGKAPRSYRDQFAEARLAVDRICGAPGLLGIKIRQPVRIEVTGIGFFDEAHLITPNGMPSNFREIHPVIHIRVLS
ncbi:MAG: hypothetical protein Q8922_08260 [Bacteroidota bacterium]|nr:hypothetical protein [Bacteroidota bacterium]MDP4233519.1 hypothetical protein [Bacteroidota bacterium]MDP4243396.1 hypothetical protein [Bacteroidota bacterium]MDP4287917.1 hypothetical protein [Bacteroidota bacterium]